GSAPPRPRSPPPPTPRSIGHARTTPGAPASPHSAASPAHRSAGAVVDRALDLGLELDVAAQEVVVLFPERLGVAALAGLDAPGLGELVEAFEELLGVAERLQERARAVGLDELDAAVVGRSEEGEDHRVGVLVADGARDGPRRQVGDVLGD